MQVPTDLDITTARIEDTTAATGLGQEEFLRMLIAQLENQDPLNPQDSTEFTAQLAQFSSLEQAIAMRTSLDEIAQSLDQGDKGTAIDMIGKQVLAESDAFTLGADGANLVFELAGASDATRLSIRDSRGDLVRTIDPGPSSAGLSSVPWDGKSQGELPLPPGVYQLTIEASAGGLPVPATALVDSVVTGADVSTASPFLRMGDVVVPFSGVREVRATPAGATP